MKGLVLKIAGVLASLCAPFVITSVAHAATITWSGGGTPNVGGSYDVSDTANWVGGVAPTTGDVIVFPMTVPSSQLRINNDLTAGTSFAGVQVSGVATSCGSTPTLIFSGNAIALTGDLAVTATGGCTASINIDIDLAADVSISSSGDTYASFGAVDGNNTVDVVTHSLTVDIGDNQGSFNYGIAGSGLVNIAGSVSLYYPNPSYSGDYNVAAGSYLTSSETDSLGTSAVTVTVASGGSVVLCGSDAGVTYPQSFVLAGEGIVSAYDGSMSGALILTKFCGLGGGGTYVPATTTISGNVTLSANTKVRAWDNLKVTGPLSGAFTIGSVTGSTGKLMIESSANTSLTPNGVIEPEVTTTSVTDSKPGDDMTVGQMDVIILNGSRKDVYVNGTLKGTGTIAGTLNVAQGAKLAPGLSPGCINSGNLILSGTYEVELADLTACTEYDQTNVTGTVDVTGSTLSVVRFDGMVPRLNDSFTIILNDGTDAVTGTFTGIAQGGTIVSGGITYSVSYTGGTGNDVVLVVTAVDSGLGAPNTGVMQIVKSGTILPILAILSALGIVGINFVHKKQ